MVSRDNCIYVVLCLMKSVRCIIQSPEKAFNEVGLFCVCVQLGAGPLDPVLCILWWRRRLAGPQRAVCGGGHPRTVLPGGGVEVHPLPSTYYSTDLQHVCLPRVGGHGVVSGQKASVYTRQLNSINTLERCDSKLALAKQLEQLTLGSVKLW